MAVLVIVPVVDGATVTITVVVAAAPSAMLPRSTVNTPLAKLSVPWLGVAETKVTPVGRVSVMVTPVAAEGPLLVVVSV